jgi:hypothetical protein
MDIPFALAILLVGIRNSPLYNNTLRNKMIAHFTSCKLKIASTMNRPNNDTLISLKKSLRRKVKRKGIALQTKAKGKPPVGLVIQDIKEVLLTVRRLDRKRATKVHVKEISNKMSTITS